MGQRRLGSALVVLALAAFAFVPFGATTQGQETKTPLSRGQDVDVVINVYGGGRGTFTIQSVEPEGIWATKINVAFTGMKLTDDERHFFPWASIGWIKPKK